MTSTSNHATPTEDETTAVSTKGWRVVDIVVTAVLGVATGLIFYIWNFIGGAGVPWFDAITPGLGGLASGVWVLGGVIGGLAIRKPGAAILVEMIAAYVSFAIGNQWGIETLYSGAAQGLGAELVFALFLYRRFSLNVALLAGLASGIGAFILELFLYRNIDKTFQFNAIYLVTWMISGAILAGLLGWLLVRALARTGALGRFAAGREAQQA